MGRSVRPTILRSNVMLATSIQLSATPMSVLSYVMGIDSSPPPLYALWSDIATSQSISGFGFCIPQILFIGLRRNIQRPEWPRVLVPRYSRYFVAPIAYGRCRPGKFSFPPPHSPLRNTTRPNNFLSPRHTLAGRGNSLAKAVGPCRCLCRSYAPDLSTGAARLRTRLEISRRRGGHAPLHPTRTRTGRVSILGRDAPIGESHLAYRYFAPEYHKFRQRLGCFLKGSPFW